jgi:hypothetical protein
MVGNPRLSGSKAMPDFECELCKRSINNWFLRLRVEDNSGYRRDAHVCANCGVKLRLASEKTRDLQIDPWFHGAVATVLRGDTKASQ